jgi:hypothetical protein
MKVVAKYSLAACLYALPVMYLVAGYHLTAIPGVRVFRFTTGWKELGKVVGQEAQAFEIASGRKVLLLGLDSHYVAAALSFYAGDGREVFSRNLVGKRALAFEYWPPKTDLVGFDALAVDINRPDLKPLRKYFARVDENVKRIPVLKSGRILNHIYVVKCFGYMGREL